MRLTFVAAKPTAAKNARRFGIIFRKSSRLTAWTAPGLANMNVSPYADPKNAEVKAEAEMLAAKAKLYAANAAWDAADHAVQLFGGRGWSTLYRPGRHLQDTRVCRIYEGTDEILKLKIAAALLGKEYEAFK